MNKEDLIKPEYLQFAFDFFDKDRSGQIDIKEIKAVFLQNEENSIITTESCKNSARTLWRSTASAQKRKPAPKLLKKSIHLQ